MQVIEGRAALAAELKGAGRKGQRAILNWNPRYGSIFVKHRPRAAAQRFAEGGGFGES